jgi:hypothetical protein
MVRAVAEEKLPFTRRLVVLGNLGLLTWLFLAALNVLFYNYLWGWLYLVVLVFLVYGVLRQLGCVNGCYRCKNCSGGFGRLAGAFFGRGAIKWESVGRRLAFVAFLYVLLLPVPIAFLVLSPHGLVSLGGVFVLICLLLLAGISLFSWIPTRRRVDDKF